MNTKGKVLFNTMVLYVKILISLGISLFTMPLILRALGESDYGVYHLVAGVISMLSFLNASMAVSTQRYLSVSIGEGDKNKFDYIFNTSIVLHFVLGVLIVIIFEVVYFFIFDSLLIIDSARINAAKIVYQCLAFNAFFTILSVPYSALLNAKENMVAFSVIDIFITIAHLVCAILLLKCETDRLIFYAVFMMCVSVLSVIINRIYVRIRYKDISHNLKRFFDKKLFRNMFGFAGWNTLGALSLVARNQGIAIVINQFFTTVANAAYGIANQINGILNSFSVTFQKALNPQLMQSEGKNDRDRLIRLSITSSKYSVLVLSAFALPLIVEMKYILTLWLRNVPIYAVELTTLTLILAIIVQYSAGLKSAIQAVGKIKKYFILISIIILMNIPITYYLFNQGFPVYYCILVYVILETVTLIVRLYFAKTLVGMSIWLFIKKVVLPTVICFGASACFSIIPHSLMDASFVRLVLVILIYATSFLILAWLIVLDCSERAYFGHIIKKYYSYVCKKKD